MNYRHAYHAGNFADVLKHAVLLEILDYLHRKDAPIFALDTHAGAGFYDLDAEEAQATGEHGEGIGRVLAAPDLPPELDRYVAAIEAFNRGLATIGRYPGSPALLRAALRPGDRLVLCETHPSDGALLERRFSGDPCVRVSRSDGWTALKALLPPVERRGLVHVDPSFEGNFEAGFARAARGLGQAYRRFATGCYVLWYPIKATTPIVAFHRAVVDAGIRRVHVVELSVRPSDEPALLTGCGLLLVNPPWTLAGWLDRVMPWLHRTLAFGGGGYRSDILIGE